jgi:nucleoside-diphosphate-sugar epimerase
LAARARAVAICRSKWRGECAVKAVSENMRWTVLRPPAVFGPGIASCFRCFAASPAVSPALPAGMSGRFSLLYIDDLATAVLRWLEADTGYGETFELDDGRPGGYDWDTVVTVAGRVLRAGAPVRRVPIPVPLLDLAGQVNLATARLLGYAPMLTPGKIREITHPDWLCDSRAFARATGWRPTYALEPGLAHAYGRRRSG